MRSNTLNIRTTNETKHLLQQAANMLGTTVSGFLLHSATEKAHEIMQNQNHFFLSDIQWDMFCEKLDRTPISNRKLQLLLSNKGIFSNE